MTVTGPQAKAARALIQWSRAHVARLADLSADQLADFEAARASLPEDVLGRLLTALESGGAQFLDETAERGAGVRLKFPTKDLRPIGRLENEGGPVADDDV
jgi:transcriptional regulator with XRE-family HTH domain